MQKKYISLTIAIFLCFIVIFASTAVLANQNACEITLVTPPTGGAPATFHPGDNVERIISVESSNTTIPASPSVMTNLTIFDLLSPNCSFVPGSNASSSPATFTIINDSLLEWNFGSAVLNGMPQATVTFNITINSGLTNGTTMTNNANWTAEVYDVIAHDYSLASATAFDSIVVIQSTPTLVTAFNVTSPITMGTPFHDNATLGGHVLNYSMGTNANITFYMSTDDVNWVQIGSPISAPANGGTVSSSTVTGLGVGLYYFKANYTGNIYYIGATSANASEILNITRATSTTATYLSATTITLGGTVYDTANVTFPLSIPPYPVPTGTVTFLVQLTNGTWVPLGTVSTVWDNNTKQYYAVSTGFTPTQVGTYHFNATYSGDGSYKGSTLSVLEPLVVGKATTTVTTIFNATQITVGSGVYDNATVTGPGGVPTGFVLFQKNATGTWVNFANVTLINGVAPFANYTPGVPGTFFFQAVYSGDSNYNGSTSALENVTVGKSPTTTTTQVNATTILLGGTVHDTANVSFVVSIPPSPVPTGTVTFTVELLNGTWIPLGTVSTVWDNNTKQYYAVSTGFTPTQVGSPYAFNATYSGDSYYAGSYGTYQSSSECVSVNPVTPTVTTLLNATSITVGQNVTDQATVMGLPNPPYPTPTGTIQFYWGLSVGTWTALGSPVTMSSGAAVSPMFHPSQPGTYYFMAAYSGDTNYNAANSTMTEVLTVTPTPSTLTTLVNATTIMLGGTVHDTANVTFPVSIPPFPVPTGNVTFWVQLPSGTSVLIGTVSATWYGSTQQYYAVSADFTPTQTGSYLFHANYTGDNNYTGSWSWCNCPNETVTVTPATPTATTLLNASTITLGKTITDQVTVWGLPWPTYPTPTGTVQFYWNLNGGSWNALGSPVTLAGASAVSPTFQANKTGTYYFMAGYLGDGNYSAANSTMTEVLTVNLATPTATTLLSASTITLGNSITDQVTVLGLPNPPYPTPTGTVQFYWNFANGSWIAFGSPVTLVSGAAVSTTFQANKTGTYYFMAGYSGDGNYTWINSNATAEVLTVTPFTPGVTTLLNATTIAVGQNVSVTDQATVWGLLWPTYPTPTGTIQFYWNLNNGSWNALGSPVTMASGSALSPTFQPSQAGTYYFMAGYSGDSSYNAANSTMTEVLNVTRATPVVCTQLSTPSINLGQNVNDQVTVWGLPWPTYPVPTGTVQFQNNDTGVWVTYYNATLVSGMATSATFTPTHAGLFFFRAVYSGDTTYTSAQSGLYGEILTVYPPTPTISTTLSNGVITIGSTVYDNATLTGYGSLSLGGANVQFWYMAPGGQWTLLSTTLVTNVTSGTFTSISFTPTMVGNYSFKANYTGNANYRPGESPIELLQVQQYTPTINTYLSAFTITLGGSIYDNVTVTGNGVTFPTGTVQFQNNDTGVWVTYYNATLVSGMATSATFTPTHAGLFFFRAVYNGDANYLTVHSCPYCEMLQVNNPID